MASGDVLAPEPLLIFGGAFGTSIPGITSPELAAQEVRRQKQAGGEFIKVVNASREVLLATLEEAKRQGLDVVGHLVPQVSGTEASNAGINAFEHLGSELGSVLFDCSSDETSARDGLADAASEVPQAPLQSPDFRQRVLADPIILLQEGHVEAIQRAMDSYSDERCRALVEVLNKNETWQVPTLIRLKTMLMPNEYLDQPELNYVAPATKAIWRDAVALFNAQPDAWESTYREFYDHQLELVALLNQAGVKLLAGDDVGGGWVVGNSACIKSFASSRKPG